MLDTRGPLRARLSRQQNRPPTKKKNATKRHSRRALTQLLPRRSASQPHLGARVSRLGTHTQPQHTHDHGEHEHDATSVATAGLVISVLALTVATAGLCLTMSLRKRHAAQPMMSEAATMRRHSASFGAGGDAAQSKGERGMQV